ncbi:ABC transporter substrate-binding protein [Agromyces protaetiae]|uniref:ABC transporter substrate-binding protein n=1 Tax=Agromyces protaetiae TaxID=2509455 RepID=A0A4V0YHB8_9MICO|nr:ABC transporter substrate-binding protein [Agromyces protaetiae]QAY74161.1 ABC transporter substrate-binding protein [Agromyces protaetiae]
MHRTPRLFAIAAATASAALALALTGCASGDPLSDGGDATGETSAGPIVIGSQAYYSNRIIAEIYAQALEANGFEVDRQFDIGQREVYLPEVEAGEIDLFPEYTGNLLQYWVPDTEARTSDDVYAALEQAVPDGLRVLDQSPATDQDSYNVTRAFSEEFGATSLADLADVSEPLTLGGNAELETRPYGPTGLKSDYGVDVGFKLIADSGGALTVKALIDDEVQLVNIYSADPNIATNDLVTLADPKGLFLASNVVPLASDKITDEIAAIIDAVSAAMSPADLVAINDESVNEQRNDADIAKDWLAEKALF